MRDLSARCEDILDAIEKIEIERMRGKDAFDADEKVQVWMVHHLMIIGEAVRGIDPAIKQKHPEIEWARITGMRNIIVHDYFRINKPLIWKTVNENLESLKAKIEGILRLHRGSESRQ